MSAPIALLLAAPSLAGTFAPFRSRDALPAREVERAPVLVMGWTATRAEVGQEGGGAALTHGLWRRVEAWVDVSWDPAIRWRDTSFGAGALVASWPTTWLRWELGHRAALRPTTGWRDAAATGSPTPVTWTGLLARQRVGGLRLDAGGDLGVAHPGAWGSGGPVDPCAPAGDASRGWVAAGIEGRGAVDALVQAGPVVVGGGVSALASTARDRSALAPADERGCEAPVATPRPAPADRSWTADAGGGAQLSRGVAVWAGYEAAVAPRAPGAWSGRVEVAW